MSTINLVSNTTDTYRMSKTNTYRMSKTPTVKNDVAYEKTNKTTNKTTDTVEISSEGKTLSEKSKSEPEEKKTNKYGYTEDDFYPNGNPYGFAIPEVDLGAIKLSNAVFLGEFNPPKDESYDPSEREPFKPLEQLEQDYSKPWIEGSFST